MDIKNKNNSKKFKEELISAKKRLEDIIQFLPDATFVVDNEGKVVAWNKAIEILTLVKSEDIIGKGNYEYSIPFYHKRTPILIDIARNINTDIQNNYDFIKKNRNQYYAENYAPSLYGGKGAYIWITASPLFDENGNLVGAIESIRDITDRKLNEQQLRESEDRYRSLVEFLPEAIALIVDKKIEYINPLGLKLIGATNSKEIIGKDISNFIYSARDGDSIEIVKLFSSKDKNITTIETKLIRLDGLVINIEATSIPIDYKGKNTILIVIRDITEKLIIEKELQNIDKLESLGILAGGVAHDFNNILAGISLNISYAKLHIPAQNLLNKILTDVEKETLRAKELTQQLLTYSKGGAPIKKIVSIYELLHNNVSFSLRGTNVKSELHIDNNLDLIEVDEMQMIQIINNIVINAHQAMPDGGILTVKAENFEVTEDNVRSIKKGKYIKISFKDSGYGIAKENLKKIFDPYFTTKKKGSGLGLAIVYSIIKKHRGFIEIESTEGAGTTVIIYLPVASSKKIEELKINSTLITGKGKILIMDDEQEIRDSLKRIINIIGYDSEVAKDGNQAIEIYKKALTEKKPIDVVIIDLTIPGGMGGKDTIKELLKIDPKVKAIVTSGFSNDPIMLKYKEYGFKGVIAKPYSIEDLSKLIYDTINSN